MKLFVFCFSGANFTGVPYNEKWEKDGIMVRDIWYKAGEMGFLYPSLPEEYGGSGIRV
ncbi:conserved domain protein [delta proteobacterium NaphS2]|nr:conserved domain protein [delta proteobacterium NaphS2]